MLALNSLITKMLLNWHFVECLMKRVELGMVKQLTLYAVNHAHLVTVKMTILN